ncbi:Positive regulator of phenol hydroxylase, DmpR [Minicystis rosea]|nr:Positive regulator of phenol hydroxylase, DmpR [Minicystis rosea]
MIVKLTVRAPDVDRVIEVAVAPGSGVLIGRRPDLVELRAHEPAEVEGAIAEVTVDAPGISKNHALVRVERDGRIVVRDLRSRRGTSVRVPKDAPVVVAGGGELEIELSSLASKGGVFRAPPEARWSSVADFAEGVRQAIQRWLGGALEVTIGRVSGPREVASFTLADGSELSLAQSADGDTQVMPAREVIEILRRWVGEQNALLSLEQGHGEGFLLSSPAIRNAHREVADAAVRGMNVVLIGPTGAGKEELARCYHLHSGRAGGPFVMFRCQNMVGDFGYIDLFGVIKGAVHDVEAREGAVEQANHGTLFLDEIQDLRPREQANLLGFSNYVRQPDGSVRRGEFSRMGEKDRRKPRYADDVNLVCASLCDLDDPEVRRQLGFREDLWFRLAVRVIRVPPLAERPEDVRAFLESHPRGGAVKLVDALTPEALAFVMAYPFPGNFRELSSFVARLPADLAPRRIDRSTAEQALQMAGRSRSTAPPPAIDASSESCGWEAIHAEAKRLFERDHGATPTPRQVDRYYQDYLKPVMITHACGCSGIREMPKVNCSELARKLGFCDGTSVRNHLKRYVELNKV